MWIEADEDDVEPRRVPRRELTEATRSLAALLAAGLPLTKALETTRDVVGGGISPVLDDVIVEVKGGAALAKALAAHPDIFSPLYVGVVRAGERSGRLASITDRLAEELERQDDLRSRIVSASIYPTALLIVGAVSVMVLLLLVIPRFGALLAETGAELPAATRALISVSEGVRSYWPYLVGALVVAFTSAAAFLSSPAGVHAVSKLSLGLPIIGPIRRGLLGARLSRLLAVLLEGGAPLVAGLSDAAESIADPVASEEVHRIREEVRTGVSLQRSFASSTMFPEELTRLVAVGEESGRLTEFLGRAAEMLEGRSVRAMERAVSLFEPVVIVVFGGLVALVALALLQAIYGVNAGTFG